MENKGKKSEYDDKKIEELIRQREEENRALEKILENIKEQLENEKLDRNDKKGKNENSK